MHNGSFPHSCVWSIPIKSELEESKPPRKQKDFYLAVQWRGPSSAHGRRSMASEANVPIMWILFIIFQICHILKVHPWKTGENDRMQTKSCNVGSGLVGVVGVGAACVVGGISACVSLRLFLFTGDLQGWGMRGSWSRAGEEIAHTAEQYQPQRKWGVNKGNGGWFPLDTIYFSHHKEGNWLYFTPATWCVVYLVVSMLGTGSVFSCCIRCALCTVIMWKLGFSLLQVTANVSQGS